MNTQNSINPDLTYTNFPIAADTFDRKIDVSLDIKPLVDQYYVLHNAMNFEGVKDLIEANPRLKQCITTAEDFNRMIDAIVAVQRIYLSDISEHIINLSKPKGTWNKDTKYQKYNVVTFEVEHVNQTYVAMPMSDTVTDIPIGTLPTEQNYWICITMRGEKGAPGTGLTPCGSHSLGHQYYKDDLVSYDNCLWYALVNNYDIVPNRNSMTWQLLMQFTGDLLKFDNTGTNLSSTTMQNAVVELNNKTRIINNVMIPMGGFINNIYTYKNPIVSNVHAADVYYRKSSRPIARKADIEVETFDGSITFTARKIPKSNLEISSIILTQT